MNVKVSWELTSRIHSGEKKDKNDRVNWDSHLARCYLRVGVCGGVYRSSRLSRRVDVSTGVFLLLQCGVNNSAASPSGGAKQGFRSRKTRARFFFSGIFMKQWKEWQSDIWRAGRCVHSSPSPPTTDSGFSLWTAASAEVMPFAAHLTSHLPAPGRVSTGFSFSPRPSFQLLLIPVSFDLNCSFATAHHDLTECN